MTFDRTLVEQISEILAGEVSQFIEDLKRKIHDIIHPFEESQNGLESLKQTFVDLELSEYMAIYEEMMKSNDDL